VLHYFDKKKKKGNQLDSGRHIIHLNGKKSLKVYCDMDTDGGGWTVFQRRGDFDTHANFYATWSKYRVGFGDDRYEFWLGNDDISTLTNQDTYYLRIDLEDFQGNERYALYSNFKVEDESNQYRMTVDSFVKGDAGDSLIPYHNGKKFSTRDRDNDNNSTGSCANLYKGGWWYGDCHQANLNGLYLFGDHSSYANGINWITFKGYYYSLKETEMKIRPTWFKKN